MAFVITAQCVYCEVGTEFICVAEMNLILAGVVTVKATKTVLSRFNGVGWCRQPVAAKRLEERIKKCNITR